MSSDLGSSSCRSDYSLHSTKPPSPRRDSEHLIDAMSEFFMLLAQIPWVDKPIFFTKRARQRFGTRTLRTWIEKLVAKVTYRDDSTSHHLMCYCKCDQVSSLDTRRFGKSYWCAEQSPITYLPTFLSRPLLSWCWAVCYISLVQFGVVTLISRDIIWLASKLIIKWIRVNCGLNFQAPWHPSPSCSLQAFKRSS